MHCHDPKTEQPVASTKASGDHQARQPVGGREGQHVFRQVGVRPGVDADQSADVWQAWEQ